MSRLIAFGDSFTFGNDLHDWIPADENDPLSVGIPSQFTWPALLAKHLKLEYVCLADPGSSNSSILRTILSTDIRKDDLVIINWTWIDRWDFYDGKNWETLRPNGTEKSKFYKQYYKYFQSELWDKFETLKHMQTAFSTLDNFISTTIDPLTIDKQWHCPTYVEKLIDIVNCRLTWFNGTGFYNWAIDKNLPISKNWHPLEDAHQAAFEYIKNELSL